MGERVLRDGIEIDRNGLYRRYGRAAYEAISEAPTREDFRRVYGELLRTADQILSIHVSSRINSTYSVAQDAAKLFLGRSKISVVDSRLLSNGLELVVRAAAEAARAGASMPEIVRLTRGMIPQIYMVFFVENAGRIQRRGFVPHGDPFGDGMQGGRPLVIVEDGEIATLDRVRTRGRSVDRLFEFVSEFVHFDRVTILQGRLADEAQLLFQRLNEAFPDRHLEIRPYGAVLTSVLGPDALGVGVYDRG
jgi:DegV family protein with EDD domain